MSFAEIFKNRLYVELQRHPMDGGLPAAEQRVNRFH